MPDHEITLQSLGAMRVASTHALGVSPEGEAVHALLSWAQSKGYLDDPALHPMFGFDNPLPQEGNPEYGYECWMSVDPGAQSGEGVTLKDFDGGLYAVLTCEVKGAPGEAIPAGWQRLWEWLQQSSAYTFGSHQHLEKFRNPTASPEKLILDLYCPVQPRE